EGGNPFAALMKMQDEENGGAGEEDGFTPGGNATFPLSIAGQEGQGGPNGAKNGKAGKKPPRRKYLDTYCENLTAKARDGRLDDIIGRDREIYRTIQILSRRQKNNPCLIGEAGVGKTAIAEGIAERIARGQVPAQLKDKEIYLLDLTALVAGTQIRGQFEQRVDGLLDEGKQAGNVIRFVDESHNITTAASDDGTDERTARGQLPAQLKDREISRLDLTALAAGTQFRGQFEQRVKGLLNEVKQAGNVILFIDEIHTIPAAGESEGALNAGNILKPALSRGEIQVIGATTFSEYRKYIEK